MIEIQDLQHVGWILFLVVTGYSLWVAILAEKNKKHQHSIWELLQKLQARDNEVDQYLSTVRDQIKQIAALNQNVDNLKLEVPFIGVAYQEAMRQLNDVSIERDEYRDIAIRLYCQKHGMKTAIEVAEELDKIAISPVSLDTVKRCKEIYVGYGTAFPKDGIFGVLNDTGKTVIIGYLPEKAIGGWKYVLFNEDDLSAD